MDTLYYILITISIVLLIISSAVFSFSEMAFANLSKIRIKTIKNKSKSKRTRKKIDKVIFLRERYNKTSTSIVIMNNIINIVATSLAAALFGNLFGSGLGVLFSTIIMSILVITFGEIIPKLLAKKNPERGTIFFSNLLIGVYWFFYPITYLLAKVIKEEEDSLFKNEDELNEALKESQEKGIIDKGENELIFNTLKFDKNIAMDIMQKKEDVIFIQKNISEEELELIIIENGYSRLPVLNEKNKVIGIFNVKLFFTKKIKNIREEKKYNFENTFKESIQEVIFVNKNENVKKVLEMLRSFRRSIAVVNSKKNEKDLFGIITMEDLLEEIVGEIYDENDYQDDGIYEIGLETIEVSYWAKAKDIFEKYFDQIKYEDGNEDIEFGQWINKTFNKNNDEENDFFSKNKFFHIDNLIIWVKKNENEEIFFEVDLID